MMNNENIERNDQETIFTENEFSNEGYDKHIRQARNTLFILAGLQLILAVYSFAISNTPTGWITFALACFIAIVFAGLGFWTKKKPFTAIVVALVIYILLWVGDSLVDPTYIFRGIIIRIAVIIYLAKGLADAKEAQSMKQAIGNNV